MVYEKNYGVVAYKKIYPQRIDGMTLNSSKVLYSAKNSAGEITDLIINDVTGDARMYGIIMDKDSTISKTEGVSSESYVIDFGSTTGTYSYIRKLSKGTPVWAYVSGNEVKAITELESYSGYIDTLTHSTAIINNTTYELSDSVLVYRKDSSNNILRLSIDEAMSGNYNLKAYYDKPQSSGGRIRVIVAQSK